MNGTRRAVPQFSQGRGHDAAVTQREVTMDESTATLDEVQGEREVLGIGPGPSLPVVFAREVEIPKLGRPRLKMRVAGSQGRKWQVEIGFHG